MTSKLNPQRVLTTFGWLAMLALPGPVLAHQGHANSVWHAVLHLTEVNGLWLAWVSLAIMFSFVWRARQRRLSNVVAREETLKEQDHDSR